MPSHGFHRLWRPYTNLDPLPAPPNVSSSKRSSDSADPALAHAANTPLFQRWLHLAEVRTCSRENHGHRKTNRSFSPFHCRIISIDFEAAHFAGYPVLLYPLLDLAFIFRCFDVS